MKCASFSAAIRRFSLGLYNRLDEELINSALDYLNYNEEPLALEILCDHVIEYDVNLSDGEKEQLKTILNEMNIDTALAPYKHLHLSNSVTGCIP